MTDNRFRRVAQKYLQLHTLDPATAVELTAFLHICNPSATGKIFGWSGHVMVAAWALLKSEPHCRAAQPLIEANARALSVDAGLAVLQAMKDGGWKASGYRPVPWIVKQTLLELVSRGMKGVDVAKLAGISPAAIYKWRKTPRASTARSRAAASLAL